MASAKGGVDVDDKGGAHVQGAVDDHVDDYDYDHFDDYVHVPGRLNRFVVDEDGEPDAMLLGTAMLAASASGEVGSVGDAMSTMAAQGELVAPRPATKAMHDARYEIFLSLYDDDIRYREIARRHRP